MNPGTNWPPLRLIQLRQQRESELFGNDAGRVVGSNPDEDAGRSSAPKVKIDQADAGILAQLLVADFIPPVWVPEPAASQLRRMVSNTAASLVQRSQLRIAFTRSSIGILSSAGTRTPSAEPASSG